jgi:hypothetical protein
VQPGNVQKQRNASFTSPIEVGYIRLRQIKMTNSGKPELDGRGERAAAAEIFDLDLIIGDLT